MDRAASPSRLGPAAALASLAVIALGVTGLFSLHIATSRNEATLQRLSDLHATEIAVVDARADFKTQVQEWKNLLLRSRDDDAFARYQKQFHTAATQVAAGLADAGQKLADLGEDGDEVAGLIAEHQQLNAIYHQALANFDRGNPASIFAADDAVRGADRPLNEHMEAFAVHIVELARQEHLAAAASSTRRYRTLRTATLTAAAIAIACLFGLVVIAIRASRP